MGKISGLRKFTHYLGNFLWVTFRGFPAVSTPQPVPQQGGEQRTQEGLVVSGNSSVFFHSTHI